MSYESRIFVVNRSVHKGINETYVYGEKIADVKMSRMLDSFTNLFNQKIDYKLYIDNCDESTQTDKYGEIMRYTDRQTVIDYLEELIESGDNYRRLTILLGLLKGINEEQWDDIQVVHYGY